jgi:hypothetical protein
MKCCFDKYILHEQSIVVEGRSILNNALIYIEIIYAVKRKTKRGGEI